MTIEMQIFTLANDLEEEQICEIATVLATSVFVTTDDPLGCADGFAAHLRLRTRHLMELRGADFACG
jgi:hypothetical protein